MAIIFSDNVTEVAVQHLISGRPAVNVLHVKTDTLLGTFDPEETARDLLDNWQDHIIPLVTSNVVVQGAAWRSLDEGNGASGFLIPDGDKPTEGGQAGAAATPNVAWLIRKEVTGRSRTERNGRMYIAGVEEAGVTAAGVVSGDYPTLWSDALEDFLSGVDGGVLAANKLVVLTIPKAARAPGPVEFTVGTNDVSRLVLDPLVATMRKRLR